MAIINYGYKDGSGNWFITVDTDKCDGCGKCVEVCKPGVLGLGEDPSDPLRDTPIVVVTEEHRKKIKYSCAPCKPVGSTDPPPCVKACEKGAIWHSW